MWNLRQGTSRDRQPCGTSDFPRSSKTKRPLFKSKSLRQLFIRIRKLPTLLLVSSLCTSTAIEAYTSQDEIVKSYCDLCWYLYCTVRGELEFYSASIIPHNFTGQLQASTSIQKRQFIEEHQSRQGIHKREDKRGDREYRRQTTEGILHTVQSWTHWQSRGVGSQR